MSDTLVPDLMDELYTRIDLKKTLSGFAFNGFTLERSFFPYKRNEELVSSHPQGIVYIVGMATDDENALNRNNASLAEVPIQVAYQRGNVNPHDYDSQKTLLRFERQLRDVCRKEVDLEGYSWVRNEALKDEAGTPFAYTGLREGNFWEAYFTAFYNFPLTS